MKTIKIIFLMAITSLFVKTSYAEMIIYPSAETLFIEADLVVVGKIEKQQDVLKKDMSNVNREYILLSVQKAYKMSLIDQKVVIRYDSSDMAKKFSMDKGDKVVAFLSKTPDVNEYIPLRNDGIIFTIIPEHELSGMLLASNMSALESISSILELFDRLSEILSSNKNAEIKYKKVVLENSKIVQRIWRDSTCYLLILDIKTINNTTKGLPLRKE
jgi:hypothetical protein